MIINNASAFVSKSALIDTGQRSSLDGRDDASTAASLVVEIFIFPHCHHSLLTNHKARL